MGGSICVVLALLGLQVNDLQLTDASKKRNQSQYTLFRNYYFLRRIHDLRQKLFKYRAGHLSWMLSKYNAPTRACYIYVLPEAIKAINYARPSFGNNCN